MSTIIRDATDADLPAIREIYNHYVRTCTCTFQIDDDTAQARQAWWEGRGPLHPVLVAEEAGKVVSWGSLNSFNKREAFALTVEDSVYVHHAAQGRGLGRALLGALIERAQRAGVVTIIAAISADQARSIELHRRMGFVETGRLLSVGRKFGKTLDLVYLQLMPGA